jgi:hypothetical protein
MGRARPKEGGGGSKKFKTRHTLAQHLSEFHGVGAQCQLQSRNLVHQQVPTYRPAHYSTGEILGFHPAEAMNRFLKWSSINSLLTKDSMTISARKMCLVSSFQNVHIAGNVHVMDVDSFSLYFDVSHLLFLCSSKARLLLSSILARVIPIVSGNCFDMGAGMSLRVPT